MAATLAVRNQGRNPRGMTAKHSRHRLAVSPPQEMGGSMGIGIARGAALAFSGCMLASAGAARADTVIACTGISGTPFQVMVSDATKTVRGPDNIQNAGPVTYWGSDKVVWGDPVHVYTLDRQNARLHLDYENRQGTGRSAYDFKCSKG